MKKVLFLIVCAALTTAGMAQKVVNDKNAEVRNVSGYHGVRVASGIDLYISQGSTEGVAVSANEEKYRNNIKTEVENGILKIYYDNGMGMHFSWGNAKNMKAYVTIKDINELQASGGSDIYVDGALQASNFTMHVSGGSDFHGKLNVSTLVIRQSGGSDVMVSGTAGSLSIDASGGSDFKGEDMISETCNIDASGSSDVSITVNKELNVSASGSSDVTYRGNAVIKKYHASGSSDVHRKG